MSLWSSWKQFTIGDTVQITGTTMTGIVGIVVHLDEKRQKYMVRITDETQNYFTEIAGATRAAATIVTRRDISAVVCANDHAVFGLLAGLREAEVPPDVWPSLVGFDGSTGVHNHVLTSMRLPWEDIGRKAADLLVQPQIRARLSGLAVRGVVAPPSDSGPLRGRTPTSIPPAGTAIQAPA